VGECLTTDMEELKRFREREPLVQAFVEKALNANSGDLQSLARMWSAAHDVRNFKAT
jgi:hypothetical protein